MGATGPLWWLWIWAAWMAFNLLAMVIYPTFIAPWFNRFEPLTDADVAKRVSDLMHRCGFSIRGLFVKDGSKRSAKANAEFTGLGPAKRVVLFDTLLEQLSPGELDAVLAHELGHFKHRHSTKLLTLVFSISFFGFVLLGWLSQQVWFYTGLGVLPMLGSANDALALILAMLLMPLVGGVLSPLLSQVSRRYEFQADAYAISQTRGQDLASALLKLYKVNASTLTPDPLFVRFSYSHPPATERLARMSATYS
jgi:STE24 endopeptidase